MTGYDPNDPLPSGDDRTAERDGEKVWERLGDGETGKELLVAMPAPAPRDPVFMAITPCSQFKNGEWPSRQTHGQTQVRSTSVQSEKKKLAVCIFERILYSL